MIWNDCRPSSSAAAGRDREYPSLIADALRDAANPSGEFDCARLREYSLENMPRQRAVLSFNHYWRTREFWKGSAR